MKRGLIYLCLSFLMVSLSTAVPLEQYVFTAPSEVDCGDGSQHSMSLAISDGYFNMFGDPVFIDYAITTSSSLNMITTSAGSNIMLHDGFSSLAPEVWLFNCSEAGTHNITLNFNDTEGDSHRFNQTMEGVWAGPDELPSINVSVQEIISPSTLPLTTYIILHNNGTGDAEDVGVNLRFQPSSSAFEMNRTTYYFSLLEPGSIHEEAIEIRSIIDDSSSNLNHYDESFQLYINLSYRNAQHGFLHEISVLREEVRVIYEPEIHMPADYTQTINEGENLSIQFEQNRSVEVLNYWDWDANEMHNIIIASNETAVNVSYVNETIHINTSNSFSGRVNISINVSDSYGLWDEDSFILMVLVDDEEPPGDPVVQDPPSSNPDTPSGSDYGINIDEGFFEENGSDVYALHNEEIILSVPQGVVSTITSVTWSVDGEEQSADEEFAYTLGSVGEDVTIQLEVDGTGQEGFDSEINLFSVECVDGEGCDCCSEEYECYEPACNVSEDCEDYTEDLTFYFNGVCAEESDVCENTCDYAQELIECETDNDCLDDGDAQTVELCENPGTRESRCIHQNMELYLHVEEPQEGEIFETNSIGVIIDYTEGAQCQYSLNGVGNEPQIASKSFQIDALEGTNTLSISCQYQDLVKLDEVSFYVDLLDKETIDPLEKILSDSVLDEKQSITKKDLRHLVELIHTHKSFRVQKRIGEYKDGRTHIRASLQNTNTLNMHDLVLRLSIDKLVLEQASLLQSEHDFIIIEEDPIVDFPIAQLASGEDFELEFSLPNEVSEEELEQLIELEIISANISEEEQEQFIEDFNNTQHNIDIRKEKTTEGNTTNYKAIIIPEKEMTQVDIYLSIPKCMAEKVNELAFNDKNYRIIADDPLIVWHIDKVSEDLVYEYNLDKLVDEDCENEAKIFAVARIIEDTVVERDDEEYELILPVLISAIIILILLLFLHFRPPKEEKDEYYYASMSRIETRTARANDAQEELLDEQEQKPPF